MSFQEPEQSAVHNTSLSSEPNRSSVAPPKQDTPPVPNPDFEEIVDRYYRPLYQFALSLSRSEADAWDLTQQTFLTLSTKGGQLRDFSKLRSWLFTTLHRAFLQNRRHETRFRHYELSEVDAELPEVSVPFGSRMDSLRALEALEKIDEVFRAPVVLFYLENCPYKEIAAILDLPLGTVKSRIARGIAHLQKSFMPARPVFQRAAA